MNDRPLGADNWGAAARFGIFIVGVEAVPEAEWWAMAPPGVSVHAARITAPAPWATWDADRAGVTLAPDLARGAAQFAAMALDAVVLAHSSSSVAGGQGWDDAARACLVTHLHAETAVTTNGTDCTHALRHCGAKRPFLVGPPWFRDAAIAAGDRYFTDQGFAVAGSMRHRPDPKWDGTPPERLYPERMQMEQRLDLLFDQIVEACPADADSLLLVGTGLRCVGIIGALEDRLSRPVITANQASLWRCLALAGVETPVLGYGSLLSGPRARRA